jgi:hypothetical protein
MAIFARRHYKAIAQILRETDDDDVGAYALRCARERMATMFTGDNPRFDRNKFMFACLPRSDEL